MTQAIKHVNIDDKLGKVRNRVYRIGVELEGGWKRLPPKVQLVRDGSVMFPNISQTDAYGKTIFHVGELPSPILLPKGKSGQLTLETWLNANYPSHVNETCGMHCHMSFMNAFQYQQLMSDESVMWTVVEYIKRWADAQVERKNIPHDHCIFERLAGRSEFCQLVWHPDDQAQKVRKDYDHHGHGHRYTVLNYAFSKTGTIECRLLPMMPNAAIALDAIERVMQIMSALLVHIADTNQVFLDGRAAGKGEKGVSESWVVEPESVIKEVIQVHA